jgi:hypothetical protein
VIDWFFHTVFGPRKVKTDFKALANLWDVPRAESEVRRTLKLAAKYGPTDHIEGVFATWWYDGDSPCYVGMREAGAAVKCAFVLNAKSEEYFRKWPRSGQLARLMWLLQAYFESLEARRCAEVGIPPRVRFTSSPSPEVAIRAIISSGRMAYEIDRRIGKVLSENLTGPDGRPLSMAFLYQNSIGPALFDVIINELSGLPERIHPDVAKVASGANRDEIDVWLKSAGAVGSILMKLANLAAAYDDTNDWHWQQSRLYDNRVFAEKFAEAWPLLHGDWRSALLVGGPADTKPPPELVDALKALFLRFGIEILDKPHGASILQFRNIAGHAA